MVVPPKVMISKEVKIKKVLKNLDAG